MSVHNRITAYIHMEAIAQNLRVIKENLRTGTKIMAVIKTDGYGHGAVPIARMLEPDEDIWGYAVAAVSEARELRNAGLKKPILVLGYTFAEDYGWMAQHDVRPTVFTSRMAQEFADEASAYMPGDFAREASAQTFGDLADGASEQTSGDLADEASIQAPGNLADEAFVQTSGDFAGETSAQTQKIPVHLAVDTGMSRIGVPDTPEGLETALSIAQTDGIQIEGVFTHFARADEKDKSSARSQMERFAGFCDGLNERGATGFMRHCSNSAGILELSEAHMDMVRAGIILYGIYPSDEMDREKNHLYPVMELKSHIVCLKRIPVGTPVSYGGTFVSEKEMEIATIPVGYGDGYPRSLSNQGSVLIRGKRAHILGRVCMDQFMVDVTGLHAKLLDEVTLLGRDGEEEITVDELGAASGRFPYEFVCDIGKRVPRVYVD
ncbi:MAG: alanine racemase [Lachnospiraceae bacterium]|nr:alanine racemase [Lachnospiraceae bacterium]